MAASFDPQLCLPGVITLVHSGPGFITGVMVSNTSGNAVDIKFYDGLDTTGTLKMVISMPSGNLPHTTHMPRPFLRFRVGMCVDPGATYAMVWGEGN